MPVGFRHLNIEMAGRPLKVGERQVPFGVSDAADRAHSRVVGDAGRNRMVGAGGEDEL